MGSRLRAFESGKRLMSHLSDDQIDRLTIVYLDPPKEKIPRYVRDEVMDLWQLGLLDRDDKGNLVLTRLGLAALGVI